MTINKYCFECYGNFYDGWYNLYLNNVMLLHVIHKKDVDKLKASIKKHEPNATIKIYKIH